MKAIWKGAIAFGLVNIPVKLFSAVQSSALDFDMLDRKDHAKIKYKRVNEDTGREVDWGNIVKGYYLKEQYVVLDDEDFDDAAPEKTKLMEINEFVNERDISEMYYEQPYYIEPEKNGNKAYILLRTALQKSGKVGIGTFVLRNAEILAVLKPYDKMIVLHKIRFPEEIRSVSDFSIPSSAGLKPAELKMAMALIKQYTTVFKPAKYKDTYSTELMKIIKLKAAGKRATVRKLPVAKTKSNDLMSQLKASLQTKRKAG